ncbi:Cell division protein FtsI [Peptidoglycan synthetase] [hydrothermal vent metagenome]|uniref:Cell division protein FtsI [Peptidoglycan synthetase] n=1 Tax=hydrothermal vent metagenome TaxID=652676 RepID=A0A3B0SYB8_9ZZZZ
MNPPIRRLALLMFISFALLVAAATYQQLIAGPDYRDDPRNLRVAAARLGRERGTIITRDGAVVAESIQDPNDPTVFRRSYPYGKLYAHVVGYDSLLFGTTGLEASRSEDLTSERDATISGVLSALFGDDLRPKGLRLTIDNNLQQIAAAALGEQRGAVIAIDPATGAILALVSTPSFDPNTLIGPGAASAGQALDDDAATPLLNRATSQSYPPGSVFKIITLAAALQNGVANPATIFDDPSALDLPGSTAVIRNFSRNRCTAGESVNLEDAFIRSCNTIFAQLGIDVGPDALIGQAEDFGFNQDVPFELQTLASAIPPANTFEFNDAALAQTAIGQRDVQATPLQMLMAVAAIANGGEIMVPYVVEEVFTAEADVVSRTEPRVWLEAVGRPTADTVAALMERVVTSGTGRRAAVPNIRIAGKTGTAEVPESSPHAWFLGFGPVAPNPGENQIAIVVLVESGGDIGESATGGALAAPIAQQVLAAFFGIPE